jgi:hypothetical protein
LARARWSEEIAATTSRLLQGAAAALHPRSSEPIEIVAAFSSDHLALANELITSAARYPAMSR